MLPSWATAERRVGGKRAPSGRESKFDGSIKGIATRRRKGLPERPTRSITANPGGRPRYGRLDVAFMMILPRSLLLVAITTALGCSGGPESVPTPDPNGNAAAQPHESVPDIARDRSGDAPAQPCNALEDVSEE